MLKHPFLQKLASFESKATCLVYNERPSTYGELLQAVEKNVELLREKNFKNIAIMGDYDLSSVAMLLACAELSLTALPLMENDESMQTKLKEAGADAFYSRGELVAVEGEKISLPLLENLKSSALVLFSSGSTGKPKAMVHNLDTLLNSYLEKRPKKMSLLLFLLFDHIGGLNTLFNALAMGACGVALDDRKNVELLAQNIEKYKISLLPASPSFLNLFLLSGVSKNYDLSSLKIITYGTEKMPDSLLLRLKEAFPRTKFHQTFGTSEVGIIQTKSYDSYIKLEGVDYKIINNELFLRSKTQSLGYLNADNSVFGEDGYFATGDLVETVNLEDGEYIKILGRIKEWINVGGQKLLPSEVESVLLECEGVKDCLVYGEANVLTGQSVSAKLVVDERFANFSNLELKRLVKKHCDGKLAKYKIPSKIEKVENLSLNARFKKDRK